MEWEDQDGIGPDLSGDALGWGLNLSTNIKIGKKVTFRGSVFYGEGVQNYMNDAPVDVGIKNNRNLTSIEGVALPVTGIVGFFDINWNEKFSTSIGYSSLILITQMDRQHAFQKGQYAVGNLMYYPVKNAMMGVELQYGDRENFTMDGTQKL